MSTLVEVNGSSTSNTLFKRIVMDKYLLKTDNPEAEVTSPYIGVPEGFKSNLKSGILKALENSHYQNIDHIWKDIRKHREIYLGGKLAMKVRIDEFGNPGVNTRPEFAIRHPDTIRSILPSSGHPRYQGAEPSHLTDRDILDMWFDACEKGMNWSYTIVRPKFGDYVGDYLVFCPSHLAAYFAAAVDKLGKCVDPQEYVDSGKVFSTDSVHLAMPWISDQEFGGTHTILVGTGRKRQTVVNGGFYDGGTKKPVTFNIHNRKLPDNSNLICAHMAIGELLNGKRIAVGNTTAAGKSEIVTCTSTLPRSHKISIVRPSGQKFEIDLTPGGQIVRNFTESESIRKLISDDITALLARREGVFGAEIENSTFYRNDLSKKKGDLPFIDDCADGKVKGRVYWYNHGMNEEETRFLPWVSETLDPEYVTSNNRASFLVEKNPNVIPSGPDAMQRVDALAIAIPVPKLESGFSLPPFVMVNTEDFFAHCLHGRRANKGNPALGQLGRGDWHSEGYMGKMGFTLDSPQQCIARDFKFWQGLLHKQTPCLLIFNEAHQEFKYSSTMLVRALLENWYDEMLSATKIKLPGTFCGWMPDMSFLPESALDSQLWDPRTYDKASLDTDCRTLDNFVYQALNVLMKSRIGIEVADQLIGDLGRRYIDGQRK